VGFSFARFAKSRAAFSLAFALLFSAASLAQTSPPAPQSSEVLILALQALTPHAELQQHLRENLFSDSPATLTREKQLLAIQMHIVRAAAAFAPILLLAPDEPTQTAIHDRCAEFQICALLASDRVRIKIVLHDDVWVRDFGPQISSANDSAQVTHWRYFDIRTEEAKREKLQQLEAARLRLLQARQQNQDQPDALDSALSPDARKAIASTIEDKLYVLREFSQLLNETSPQRTNDDSSAYDIADAVLAAPDFHFTNSPLALDGGNLFRLDDGRCLTTRALLSRNKDQNLNVDQELAKTAGCQSVIYLEPLPGGVIEHVDMFLLPVGGKRLLLASYDLSNPFAAEYWSQLSDAERDLALHASLAMQANAERLRQLGYDVILVPSPFPQIPSGGHSFYPAVLNALVLHTADGAAHLLVPSFDNFESDIQSAALDQIKSAFGPHTELIPIEATAAAQSQGAIHCLTLTAPLHLSIFADSADSARRSAALARKAQLDQAAAAQIASQIPAAGLQGTWAIVEDSQSPSTAPAPLSAPAASDARSSNSASSDSHASASPQSTAGGTAADASPALSPQRIFFTSTEFQRGVFDRLAYSGSYVIDQRNAATWSLHLVFADHQTTPAEARWLNPNEIQFTLNHGDHTWLLHRLNSNPTSPFKPTAAEQPSPKAAAPNKSKSTTPTKPFLQPINPPNQF
jgi:agmatine/peptidylarginine deiminase